MRGDPFGGVFSLGLRMEGADQLRLGVELDDVLHLFRLTARGVLCGHWAGNDEAPDHEIGGFGRRMPRGGRRD